MMLRPVAAVVGAGLLIASSASAQAQNAGPVVRVASGALAGQRDGEVVSFKAIPYAAPPVGDLRWRPPQPVKPWTGVREATAFGPRAMQGPIYSDMIFRDNGPAEDCLYLNVWTPAKSANERP